MKVNAIFESIQGEGRMQGEPVLFIRLAGCNRNCSWCDTKYHNEFKKYTPKALAKKIIMMGKPVVWTGGEPLLQYQEIWETNAEMLKLDRYPIKHYVETNGDLITSNNWYNIGNTFEHVTISPKDLEVLERMERDFPYLHPTIKVVTDLKELNMDLIKYATMLMPLTTEDKEENQKIRQRVWEYCSKYNLFYSARLHVEVWGRLKRGV